MVTLTALIRLSV